MSVRAADQRLIASDVKVFVHLAENKDADRWKKSWREGTLVGVNDETPYGYGRAAALGCSVTFSRALDEVLPQKLLRYVMRLLLGFDFVHAWRQRQAFKTADVIWTHTESQYLAVAAVLKITGISTNIIGQSVWLFDDWDRLTWVKRQLYRILISRVDVLTFLSPANMRIARGLFPEADIRFVPFGIPAETKILPRDRAQQPFHILAIGSDRHRDWKTLVDVVRKRPDLSLTILSGTVHRRLVSGLSNVEVRLAKSSHELREAFDMASVVCVPLHHNQHASGITVIEEAVLHGVPVLASDTGGLRQYFSEQEIRYVPPGDPLALLAALLEIREQAQDARTRAVRAQARMGENRLGADDYIRNHVRISLDVLGKAVGKGNLNKPLRMVGNEA